MRYLALATDYDGTLAHNGTVSETTLHALKRLREAGRKLILVTGRQLPELQQDFDHLQLFDLAVVENGAVLHHPETEKTTALADPPDRGLVQMLRERNIGFLSVGEVIVASHEPFEKLVLEAIHDLGLEYQVIFNKGAVMVLPTGINKATGLRAALAELELSRHNVAGIGDAENDHAFLDICGCAAAVANALPALRKRADLVTRHDHGAGVCELIERMLDNDLADVTLRRQTAAAGGRADDGLATAPSRVRMKHRQDAHQHRNHCADDQNDVAEIEAARPFDLFGAARIDRLRGRFVC